MAAQGDAENQRPEHTEETPLLNGENHEAQEQVGAAHSLLRRCFSYSLKVLAILVVVGITSLFVKGWIDAGSDFDVSIVMAAHYRAWKMFNLASYFQFDLKNALKKALGGGLSGAAAMVLQVLLLMVRCHHRTCPLQTSNESF